MPILTNSDRSVLKATYVQLPGAAPASGDKKDALSNAQDKAALVRDSRPQTGEVDAVRARLSTADSPALPETTWSTLRRFEPQPLAILLPKASELADVPQEHLTAFAQGLLDHRTEQLRAADQTATPSPASAVALPSPAGPKPAHGRKEVRTAPARLASRALGPSQGPATARAQIPDVAAPLAMEQDQGGVSRAILAGRVASAHSALNKFVHAVAISPIGMLHLERIEMAPAGVERGELIATIPLAPSETTSVVQKEWAVTSEEFSSIVTDSLDNYSEKGVTEKSDLADSTESQTKHSQQLGLNASLSGSYGFVTFSTAASLNSTSSDDVTKKASRSHAAEVTSKASSRVRKERKVTIQTSSTSGTENTSTRTLTNPSATDSMRIDYFSMMRKWQVRLLQYGVRMTYDIVIPEPAATVREAHARLTYLDGQLLNAFSFALDPSATPLSPTDIKYDEQSRLNNDPLYYANLATRYSAAIPPPPIEEEQPIEKAAPFANKGSDDPHSVWPQPELRIDVKDGYEIDGAHVYGYLTYQGGGNWAFVILGVGTIDTLPTTSGPGKDAYDNHNSLIVDQDLTTPNSGVTAGFAGRRGSFTIDFAIGGVEGGNTKFVFGQRRTASGAGNRFHPAA